MIYLDEGFAGDRVLIEVAESDSDAVGLVDSMLELRPGRTSGHRPALALDTESTSFKGMYRPDWKLRLVQFGHGKRACIIPAEFSTAIQRLIFMIRPSVEHGNPGTLRKRQWVMHNAPHDVLALDLGLGIDTGLMKFAIDTHIMAHLLDSRPVHEGGLGLGVKDLAASLFNVDAGHWERKLKARFKEITVEVPGEFYKARNRNLGRQKGDPKRRKITLAEGWRHIDTWDEAYLRYAGMDVIIEYRVWEELSRRLKDEYAPNA